MSLADAFTINTNGAIDKTDHIRGWLVNLLAELEALPEDERAEMTDTHIGPGGFHLTVFEDYVRRLREAIEAIDMIRLTIQEVVAAKP